jgi:hypothetical protein
LGELLEPLRGGGHQCIVLHGVLGLLIVLNCIRLYCDKCVVGGTG